MSKINLTPNASGTGTLTVTSPNTNSDYTLTLPAVTGTFNTSGAVNEVPAGSNTAPSIYFTGDTNTGIYSPGADSIALTEGGVEGLRLNSSGNVQLAGNLGLGGTTPTTSGAGITFPATASASSNANTLDDYEEGDWTPQDDSGAGLTFTVSGASYVKIGKMVYAWMWITYPSTANGSSAQIKGLPFTVGAGMVGGGFSGYTSFTGGTITGYPVYTTTYMPLVEDGGNNITNADLSTKDLRMQIFYTV